jgi:hypothetical protein
MTDRNESPIALAERCEIATADEQSLLLEEAFRLITPPPARMWVNARRRQATTVWVNWEALFDRFTDMLALDAYESAATTLVPDGWDWLVRNDVEERGSFANVSRPNKQHIIDTWDEERRCFYAGNTDGCNYAQAATPALALAAAALKARAAQ